MIRICLSNFSLDQESPNPADLASIPAKFTTATAWRLTSRYVAACPYQRGRDVQLRSRALRHHHQPPVLSLCWGCSVFRDQEIGRETGVAIPKAQAQGTGPSKTAPGTQGTGGTVPRVGLLEGAESQAKFVVGPDSLGPAQERMGLGKGESFRGGRSSSLLFLLELLGLIFLDCKASDFLHIFLSLAPFVTYFQLFSE